MRRKESLQPELLTEDEYQIAQKMGEIFKLPRLFVYNTWQENDAERWLLQKY